MSAEGRKTLGELASVLRSKNAGPFQLTVDVFFRDRADLDDVLRCRTLSPEAVAAAYGVDVDDVRVIVVDDANAIKVVLARPGEPSGAPRDTDVYGAQHHVPIANFVVGELEPPDQPVPPDTTSAPS